MYLTVVGATGGTGRELTSLAAERGHRVRAFSRSADELATDEMVTAVQGDVLDAEAVSDAIVGADAVVCLLGRTAGNPGNVVSRGTRNVIDAMDGRGVDRLVVLTSMGLGSSSRQLPWYARIANATVLHDLMADKARQEELVAGSGLEWTIVRPGGLTDRPGTGDYVHGVALDVTAGPIPRADVADFLLRVATSHVYLRERPVVTSQRDADAGFLWDQITAVTRRLLAD